MKRLLASLLGLALCATAAVAQVRQSGTVTARHAACWTTTGVVQDCGTPALPSLSGIGTVGEGPTVCANSGPSTGPYRRLCLSPRTSGASQITLDSLGGATSTPLQICTDGSCFTVPSITGQLITGTAPFSVTGIPCFNSSDGNLIDCGLKAAAGSITTGTWNADIIQIAKGGTGANTAASARSNLGLGSMALQDSANVSITGGAITGMPTPSIGSAVANKNYVDSIAAGITPLPSSALATAAVLPNTPTYSNGTAGVGATLTAGSNTTLTVDGTAAPLNTVVLVKTQASAFQNGVYTVTQAGDGSNPWILTRATYFDQAAEMTAGSATFITAGATNIGNRYALLTTVATVGTDAVTWTQISSSNISLAVNDIFVGNASNLAVGVPLSGDCTIVAAGTITCLKTNGSSFGAFATLAANGGDTTGKTVLYTGNVGFPAAGKVRVWPIPGSLPSTIGNLQAVNAYGANIDCSALLPGPCIQAAINAALPASGDIFTQSNARDIDIMGGYIGIGTITWPGYQNVKARIGGVSFLITTHKSCEMCDFDYAASQLDEWNFVPNDIGAPGGDPLCQIVDSAYKVTTTFKIVMDITQTSGACPSGGAISNAKFEIVEMNVSSVSLVSGWNIFSPRSGQNFGFNRFKVTHAHKDQAAGITTYFSIGDQAPAGGAVFGFNQWDLAIENNQGAGSENGVDTWASDDIINLRVTGITTGRTIWFRPGSCRNIAIVSSDQSSATLNIRDDGGCSAGNGNIVIQSGRVRIGAINASETFEADGTTGLTTTVGVPCGTLSFKYGLLISKGAC